MPYGQILRYAYDYDNTNINTVPLKLDFEYILDYLSKEIAQIYLYLTNFLNFCNSALLELTQNLSDSILVIVVIRIRPCI